MSTDSSYSDQLTEEERRLGFVIRPTANRRNAIAAPPERVDAVIYEINAHDRIIKLNRPAARRPTYSLQRFGRWKGDADDKKPSWKPLSDVPYSTAESVMRAIEHGVDELLKQQGGMGQPIVVPCDPGDDY